MPWRPWPSFWCAGFTSMKIVSGGNNPPALIAQQAPVAVHSVARPDHSFALNPNIRLAEWSTLPQQQVQPSSQNAAMRPHYVIDARPVSYEPPTSF